MRSLPLLLSLLAALAPCGCAGDAPALRDSILPGDDGSTPRDAAAEGARDSNKPPGDTTAPPGDGPVPADSSVDGGGGSYNGKPGEYTRSFNGRTYRVFVPSGYRAAQPIPVLVGFHGAGDSGSNFYAFCKVTGLTAGGAPARYIVVVPDTKSPRSDWANWSGNPLNDVPSMKGEMDDVVALLADLAKDYNIDAKRRHALGFSNGGLFTAIGGFHRSQTFASLTILGYGWGNQGYPAVTPARKIPVQFGAGSGDSFHSLAQASSTFLQGRGHPTIFRSASGVGHSFSQLMAKLTVSTITSWLLGHSL